VSKRRVALPPDDGRIQHRLDGWAINGDDDMRMPHDVTREIARNIPEPPALFTRNSLSDVRARMRARARARMVERAGRLNDE
jgi:hypothetical protein